MFISSIGELEQALDRGVLSLHAKIKARYDGYNQEGLSCIRTVSTTPGRLLLAQVLPKSPHIPFETINQLMTTKNITHLFDDVYRHCGQKETVIFADHMMELGFRYATTSGISFGKDDILIPEAKTQLIEQT